MSVSEIVSLNPADPADEVARSMPSNAHDVNAAVERAATAADDWVSAGGTGRALALNRLADRVQASATQYAELICREVGKPITEARGEVARAVSILRYQAQAALDSDGELFPVQAGTWMLATRRRPRGICALITPWNFPVAIPIWKAAPALSSGNTVLLKPASAAIGCGALMAEHFAEILGDGVAQVVPGGASTASSLIDHPGVACVSFTGSEQVGRAVIEQAGARALPAQTELGGQNPSIVLADADLDRAAGVIAGAAMGYAGQKCTATSRVIVDESIIDDFSERLQAAVEGLGFGDPREESTAVGPLISESALREAQAAVNGAVERGAEVITGGESHGPGNYFAPTLVRLKDSVDELAREEVFAPVAALLPATSLDHALETANEVRFGLSAAVFTADIAAAAKSLDRLEAGMVRVNQSTAGVDFHAPFGGLKASSYGPREQGKAAREFFTTTQTVSIGSE